MLLKLPSLEYQISLNIYQHLKDIKINDHDKIVSYVHVKLEVSHYTRIKMQETKGGVSRGANSRTIETKLGYFIAWKKTLQLISCLLRCLCITMKTHVAWTYVV